MKPSEALAAHRANIRRIVESHHAGNARVFGSVVHGLDHDASDLDILVDPTAEATLFDIGAIRHELRQLLGVPVDAHNLKTIKNLESTRPAQEMIELGALFRAIH